MSQIAKFPWDYYVGTLITATDITEYPLTPYTTQLCGTTRGVDNTTVTNGTVVKRVAPGYDGTLRMDRVTASSTTATVNKPTISLTSSIDGVVTASVWVKEGTTPPTSVDFKLKNTAGTVLTTTTFTPGGLTRVSASYYTTASTSTTLSCELTWTGNATDLLIDGWQIEVTDYASEYIDNTSATSRVRQNFALPESMYAIGPYSLETNALYNRWYYLTKALVPGVSNPVGQATPGISQSFNLQQDKLILSNVEAGTHIIYVGAKAPPVWTSGDDIIDVPAPDHWILIRGAVAFLKAAIYDIGTNGEVTPAMEAFESAVVDLMRRKSGWTGHEALPAVTSVYGR